jgi:hypothetical protein
MNESVGEDHVVEVLFMQPPNPMALAIVMFHFRP